MKLQKRKRERERKSKCLNEEDDLRTFNGNARSRKAPGSSVVRSTSLLHIYSVPKHTVWLCEKFRGSRAPIYRDWGLGVGGLVWTECQRQHYVNMRMF